MMLNGSVSLGGTASTKHPQQWHDSSNLNLTQASSTHGAASDSVSLSVQTHNLTKNNNISQYQVVSDAFTTKCHTSRQLVDILDDRIRSVTTSIQRTKASLASLQNAARAKDLPLSLCVWRQTTRAGRPQREMIRDDFELALEEEQKTLLSSQEMLIQAVQRTEQMIKSLNDGLAEITHDHGVKLHSLQIDEGCLMQAHTSWPAVAGGGMPLAKQSSGASAASAESAEEKRQQDTLQRNASAKDKEAQAATLRDDNDVLIAQTTQDCLDARTNVETKMRERIAEVQSKRREIEASIADTQEKIEATSHCRMLTDTEIRSHDEPENILKLRMGLRTGRHTEENIDDPVTTEMLEQERNLKQSRAMLDQRKDEENQSMAMLLKTKQDLQADLADKTAALHLDLECQKSHGAGSSRNECILMKSMMLR